MSHPSDGVEDAPLHDLDPEAILHRDSRVLLDPQFLAAMHRELLELHEFSGSQFDPSCVDVMLRLLEDEGENFIKKDQTFDIHAFLEV